MLTIKEHLLFYLLVIFSLVNCSNPNQSKGKKYLVNNLTMNYPIIIEFGAIGKDSELPPTIINLGRDSIRISTRNKTKITEIDSFAIATNNTKFEKLMSKLKTDEITGDKKYVNPFVRDGGYMTISSKSGQKQFVNIFTSSGIEDKPYIEPDTLGLSKFRDIFIYSNSLVREITNR